MKKLILLSLVLVISLVAQAKLWRVNNNAAMNPNFTSFAEAQASASANDTLYFEGSTTSYGDITVTKPLVIIGSGYFLNENPQTQNNIISAKTGAISYNQGSSGSVITGIEVQSTITINENNISVISCYITGTSSNASRSIVLNSTVSTIGNILILGNYLKMGISSSTSSSVSKPIFNILISNNYINSNLYSCIGFGEYVSGDIKNNIFNGGSGALSVYYFKFSNNILVSGTIYNLSSNTYDNNFCSGTQFPLRNGNQQNINMTDVFVGSTGNSTDGQWQLKPYSSAKGAGNDGTDCGMFGGSSPYVLSGLPSIPAIYEIIMPSTGDNINGIDITIKAKTH